MTEDEFYDNLHTEAREAAVQYHDHAEDVYYIDLSPIHVEYGDRLLRAGQVTSVRIHAGNGATIVTDDGTVRVPMSGTAQVVVD